METFLLKMTEYTKMCNHFQYRLHGNRNQHFVTLFAHLMQTTKREQTWIRMNKMPPKEKEKKKGGNEFVWSDDKAELL